jgi:cytidylate kinase
MGREAYWMMYRIDGDDFRRVDFVLRSILRREDKVTECLGRALEDEECEIRCSASRGRLLRR